MNGARIIRFPGAPDPPITAFEFEEALYDQHNLNYTGLNIGELTGNRDFSVIADFEISKFVYDPEHGDVDAIREKNGELSIVTGPNFPEALLKYAKLGRQQALDRRLALDLAAVYVTSFGVITSRLGKDVQQVKLPPPKNEVWDTRKKSLGWRSVPHRLAARVALRAYDQRAMDFDLLPPLPNPLAAFANPAPSGAFRQLRRLL